MRNKLAKRLFSMALSGMLAFNMVPVGPLAPLTAMAANDDETLGEPTFEKSLTPNGDGTYTLSLSFTGESKVIEPTPVNVVVIQDVSGSMAYTTTSPSTRMKEAKAALNGVASTLLGLNNETYPELVQMSLMTFAHNTSKKQFGTDKKAFTSVYSEYEAVVNALSDKPSGVTNWEGAFLTAQTITLPDDDPTYYIFISDGNPTVRVSSGGYEADKNSKYKWDGNDMYGTGNDSSGEPNFTRCYNTAKGPAAALVPQDDDKKTLYTLGIYGSVDRMKSLTNYVHVGRDTTDTLPYPNDEDTDDYYFKVQNASQFNEALSKIAKNIADTVSHGDVEITDGISTGVTQSTLVNGTAKNFSYTVTPAGGTPVTWTEKNWTTDPSYATIGHAKYEDGKVTWALGDDYTVSNGTKYTVSFVVWPNQDSYDTVADLNNGLITYDQVDDSIKPYLKLVGGVYKIVTNTEQKATYSVIKQEGDQDPVVISTGEKEAKTPDPVGLVSTNIGVAKTWDASLSPTTLRDYLQEHKPKISMEVWSDRGTSTEKKINPETIILGGSSDPDDDAWKKKNLSIAPGLMISQAKADEWGLDTDDYTAYTYEGTTYYILDTGHDYSIEETKVDPDDESYRFELEEHIYHPMLVNGDLYDVTIKDGQITLMAELTTLAAKNVLRGGINLKKQVEGPAAAEHAEDLFAFSLTLKDGEGNAWTGKAKADELWYTLYDTDGTTSLGSGHPVENGDYIVIRPGQVFRIGSVPAGVTYDFAEITEDRKLTGRVHYYDADAAGDNKMVDGTSFDYVFPETSYDGSLFQHTTYTDGRPDRPTTDPAGEPHVVLPNVASDVTFTNIATKFKLSKKVTGTEAPDDTFTFTLTFKDKDDAELTGTYHYTVGTDTEAKEIKSGGTIELKAGEYATVTGLPAGTVVTVTETANPNFTADQTEKTVTVTKDAETELEFNNTFNPTTVSAVKAWNNADGTAVAPAGATITFELYKAGEATGKTITLDGTVDTTGEDQAWVATFKNLVKYDEKGEEIAYTVKETGTYAGYTPSPVSVNPDGTITNTEEVTTANAKKAWVNPDGSATAPQGATVKFTLYQNGTKLTDAKYTVTLDGKAEDVPAVTGGYESEPWTATFVKLPKTDSTGKDYTYTIAESEGFKGYTASTTAPVASGETITNKKGKNEKDVFKNGDLTVSVDGKSVAVGDILTYEISYINNNSKNETATVTITDKIPENTKYVKDSATPKAEPSDDGVLTWTIGEVPAGQGGKVSFKVEVVDEAAGTVIENHGRVLDGENEDDTNYVYNSVPKKEVFDATAAAETEINGEKVKVGDILDYKVSYELKAEKDDTLFTNIVVTDKVPEGTEFVANTADPAYSFNKSDDGTLTWTMDSQTKGKYFVSFQVRVTADAVELGEVENTATLKIGPDDPGSDSKPVTNPVLTNIRVVKVWDDEDNKDNKRPSNVTVYLFQNDDQKDSQTLGSGNNWAYNWRNQDVVDANGNPYIYSITENEVDEYSTAISSEVIKDEQSEYYGWKVFTVTNSHHENGKKEVTWGTYNYNLDGYLASPGEILTYTISYANNTAEVADVTITDAIPDFTEYVADSASDEGVCENRVVTWSFKDVQPGTGGTVTFKVQIDPSKAGILIENDAKVFVGNTKVDTNTVHTPVPKKEVKDQSGKNIDKEGVHVGDTLTYEISYQLTDTKETVTVTDIVPEGTEFVIAENGGAFDESTGVVTWNFTNQRPATYTVRFKVKVTTAALNLKQIDNYAELEFGPNDPKVRTNTVTNYPKTAVTVVKIWNDNDNEDRVRPESISFTLAAEPKQEIPEATKTMSMADEWKSITWTELPAADENGKISYTVTEAIVDKYTTTYEKSEPDKATGIVTWTFTNAHKKDKKDVFVQTVDYSVDGKPVGVGDILTYKISYTNNTSTTAEKITVTDTYPENTVYVDGTLKVTADAGSTVTKTEPGEDRMINVEIAEVPAGYTGEVSFQVEVEKEAAGTVLKNGAKVINGDNEFETNVVTNPVPKKEVFDENNVDIDGQGVNVGDFLTYKISFDLEQASGDDVIVTDTIPTGTEFVSADDGGLLEGNTVKWNLDPLPAGKDYSVSFKVKVTTAALDIDKITNTGKLKIGEGGPEIETNPVTNPVRTSVTVKKVWDDGKYAERPTEVTITLMADGATASDATKEPTGKLNDGNNWTYTWTNLPAFGDGGQKKVEYTVTEEEVNKYTTTYEKSEPDKATGIVTWTVTNKHEENEKTVFTGGTTTTNIDGKVVEAGQQLDYSIKYVNNTSGIATVTVTDKIPDYTTLVDGSISDGGTESGGTIAWTIANVPAGGSGNVTFSVKVNDDGTADGQILKNTSNVNDGKNEYHTNTVTNPVPKKEVQDEAGNDINHAQVQVGDILTYVVSYTLAEDANDVKVTDVVPTGTKFESAEDGGTESGGTVTWYFDTQTAGEKSVSFKGKVTEDALKLTAEGKSIENEAELQIGEDDPIVTNKVYNNVPEKEVKNSEGSDADKEAVKVGDILTYDLNYVLTADADYVKVSDVIPAGTEYVDDGSMDPADGTFDGSQVIWEYESGLPAGTYSFHFDVRVTAAALELDEINNTYKIKVGPDPEKESNPVTNPVNTEVHVQKKWVKGEDEYHQPKEPASVNVTLMADGATASDAHKPGINPTITLDAGSKWTGFWDDLKSVIGGKKVEYSVVETPVPGSYEVEYSSATDSDAEVDTGAATWTVTNDYKAKGEIRLEAEKKLTGREWLEGESYTFQLFDSDGETLLDEQVATAENPKVTFKALEYTQDNLDAEGKGSHVYVIKEVKDQSSYPYWFITYDEHTSYAVVDLTDAGNGVIETSVEFDGDPVFTNEYEFTEYNLEKKWDDADDRLQIRPDQITITVYGMISGDAVYTEDVILTKEDNWKAALTGLPKKYQDHEIEYYADETSVVEGYTKATESDAEKVELNTLVTNTTDTGDLSIKKYVNKATEEFDKDDTRDYQFTVTVEDGHFENIDKAVTFYTAKANSKDKEKTGTIEFKGGEAKFTLHSDEIVRIVGLPAGAAYTVEESVDAATHYDPVIYNNEGVIIKGKTQYVSYINRELDKTLITIEKKWEDGDDRDGFRPNQILVDVFKIQGGEEKLIEEDLKLTAENSWVAKLNPNGYNAVATISEASKSSANASASEAYREQASASVATASANSASFSDAEVADAFDEDGNLLDGTIFDDLFNAVKEAVTDVAGKIGALFGIDDGTKISYRVEEKEIPKYYDVTYDDCEATQNDDGSWSFTLNFTNTHELMPPVWIDPPVKKIVTVIRGTISTPETFNFRMMGLDGTTAFPKGATVYKDADGNYYVQLSITGEGSKEFGKIEYTKVGTYKYRVYEIAGNAQYYTYTTDYYDITVVVKEEGGALVETVTVKKNGTETVYSVTTRDGVKGEKLGIHTPPTPGTPMIPAEPQVPGALPKTGEPVGKAIPMLFAMLAMIGAMFGFGKKRDDEDEE